MTPASENSRSVYYGHGPWPATVHRYIINDHLKTHNRRRTCKRRFCLTPHILKRDCNTAQRLFDGSNYNNNNSTSTTSDVQHMDKSIIKQQTKQQPTDVLLNESIRLVEALNLVASSPAKAFS